MRPGIARTAGRALVKLEGASFSKLEGATDAFGPRSSLPEQRPLLLIVGIKCAQYGSKHFHNIYKCVERKSIFFFILWV
jgi:hypothetical protein